MRSKFTVKYSVAGNFNGVSLFQRLLCSLHGLLDASDKWSDFRECIPKLLNLRFEIQVQVFGCDMGV